MAVDLQTKCRLNATVRCVGVFRKEVGCICKAKVGSNRKVGSVCKGWGISAKEDLGQDRKAWSGAETQKDSRSCPSAIKYSIFPQGVKG